MHNSATIYLNMMDTCHKRNMRKIFYSSSACMNPAHNKMDPDNPKCQEDSSYPVDPDSEYGWEKLFSERLFLTSCRNHEIQVRIARFHNVFGPEGTWASGKKSVLRLYAERSPRPLMAARQKQGGMENRQDPFYKLMNVWRRSGD